MRTAILHRLLLSLLSIPGCLASAAALASAGVTSSGVTSTIGSTNPSADVQAQSSNFVQQNQQNAVTAGGTTMPASATGRANATDGSGANGKNAAANSPAGADAKSKPGEAAGGAPAAPAPPPPPPPTYVSNVRHLKPPDAATTTLAVTPAGPANPQPQPAKPTTTPPPLREPGRAAAKADANARHDVAENPAAQGGRGPAPEGYTFYIGVGIALLLLAFAFSTYLRSQKDEVAQRAPG